MEIINNVHNLLAEHHGNVVTMGNFDGVHLGHKQILSELNRHSRELGVPSLLVTFEPQPREFFKGSQVPPRLTRLREKVELLKSTQLDRLLLMPFNEQTANTPARWITHDLFHQKLGAKLVLVGDDARFGRQREGSYQSVVEAGAECGYAVQQMPTFALDEERISSTRIRAALAQADFELAQRLLGHEYFIMGRVVYGRQLGRQLDVPTANIRLQRYKAALEGVYCVTVDDIDGQAYQGIANIGVRPTVDGREPLLEVHVFDYDGNLYGRLLTVRFKHKLRDEQTFESITALKAQIDADIDTARRWFASA